MKLKILVGTMTGTADYVAQAIQMDCADLVDDIEVRLMDEHISEALGMPVALGNILWQNQLLGAVAPGDGVDRAEYYSLERFPRTTIPPSDRCRGP